MSSKKQCEAHCVRFASIASIHRFFAHLQRDDNLKKKSYLLSHLPVFGSRIRFPQGSGTGRQELAFQI